MRAEQLQVTAVVLLLIVLSIGTGTVVATVTAQRLAEPLRDVADRAARLGAGDFRATPHRHGIPELDRVSDVLDTSAVALADLVQRERTLVGDVSHQLRSRLTALQLRLDELATHPDPSARREALAALEQTERLAAVLDELLEAARVARAAGAELQDLKEALTAVADEWRPAFKAAGRSLRVRLPDGLLARVTPARLREAVGALVDNALQHGGGSVTLSARAAETSILVEVADNGAGVPEELVPHVFDRGVSVGSSTGLGLALARALVEADGGRLELSRARPAMFTIFLPAAAPTTSWAPPAPRPPPADGCGWRSGGGLLGARGLAADVLVGEDEAAEGPPAERHADQPRDDLTADEVGDLLGEQALLGTRSSRTVAGDRRCAV
jgi:signal transduction histidine kinase